MRPALLAALLLAAPAAAQGPDAVPGLSLNDAQVLARPAEGQFIVRARATVFRAELEAALARLCAAPARATPLYTERDRRPADVTYLVRCRT